MAKLMQLGGGTLFEGDGEQVTGDGELYAVIAIETPDELRALAPLLFQEVEVLPRGDLAREKRLADAFAKGGA